MQSFSFLLVLLALFQCNTLLSENQPQKNLISNLVTASSDQQRQQLLKENASLVNADLANGLLAEVPKLRSQAVYEKAFQLCDLAKQISEKIGDQKGIIDSLNMTATLLFSKDQFDDAVKKYQESLTLSENIQYAKGKADALNGMAWAQRQKGDLSAAMKNAQENLTLYQSLCDQSGMARAMHIMGIIYFDNDDREKALDLFQQSLKIREELSETLDIAHCYLTIGNVYWGNQPDLAWDYYQKAAKLFESEGEKRRLSNVYSNIATILINKGDYSRSLQY